jgi:hypothetical protein
LSASEPCRNELTWLLIRRLPPTARGTMTQPAARRAPPQGCAGALTAKPFTRNAGLLQHGLFLACDDGDTGPALNYLRCLACTPRCAHAIQTGTVIRRSWTAARRSELCDVILVTADDDIVFASHNEARPAPHPAMAALRPTLASSQLRLDRRMPRDQTCPRPSPAIAARIRTQSDQHAP